MVRRKLRTTGRTACRFNGKLRALFFMERKTFFFFFLTFPVSAFL
jgi:hypothetical protein